MFRATVETEVVLPKTGESADLSIEISDDVLRFILDGELVFEGDWTGNFAPLFSQALEMWESLKLQD